MKKYGIFLVLICFVFFASCGAQSNVSFDAQSNVSLAKFKERLNEVMNDNDVYRGAGVWGSYAASNISLAKFKERLNEVMNDNDVYRSADVWGSYAK